MAHQHSPRFLKIVEDSRKRIREISIDEVKKKMDQGEKLMLVDVREDNEWAKIQDRRSKPGSLRE